MMNMEERTAHVAGAISHADQWDNLVGIYIGHSDATTYVQLRSKAHGLTWEANENDTGPLTFWSARVCGVRFSYVQGA